MGRDAGQGQIAYPQSAIALQGFSRFFQRGARREDIVDEENGLTLNPLGISDAENLVEIYFSRLPAEETLRRRRAPLRERSLVQPGKGRSLILKNSADRSGQNAGLVEFPLGPPSAVQRDRDDSIVAGELRAAGQKEDQVLCEDLEEVAAPFEFDLVEKVFHLILITKKRPAFVAILKRNPNPFFRREELKFLNLAQAGETEALFLKL